MKRTLTQTFDTITVNVGVGIISGDLVAFLFGMAQNNLANLGWYIGIGLLGITLVLIGESRIYKGISVK